MGLFKRSGDRQHRSQASVGSAVSSCPSPSSSPSSSLSAVVPAHGRPTAVRSPAPKFVSSLVTWEKQYGHEQQQQKQQQQQQSPPLQPTAGERSQYAHAGTDWEALNNKNRDGQADGKDAPKKPSWTKRLFKGPGLGVYG